MAGMTLKLFALSVGREAEWRESVPEALSLLLFDAASRLMRARFGSLGPRENDGFFARLSQLLDVDIGRAT